MALQYKCLKNLENKSNLNQDQQIAKQLYDLHTEMALRKQQNQANPIIRNTATNMASHDKTEQPPFNHAVPYQSDRIKVNVFDINKCIILVYLMIRCVLA